ncbi:MAG: Zn-dependent hydrolase [Acidobacteriota bacterium]
MPSQAGDPVKPSRLDRYATFRLKTDLGKLTAPQRAMIPLLIEAAQQMDTIFWLQAYGDKGPLMESIPDPETRSLIEINYGPWDRLGNNQPLIENLGPKPDGACFYPPDMTKDEFEETLASRSSEEAKKLKSPYTLVDRNRQGELIAIPYSEAYPEPLQRASTKLLEASRLADDSGLQTYLKMRAEALLNNDYRPSDLAWMDMKDNTLDVVIGPIESYEDQLFGYKLSAEAYVLIKDREWSQRLGNYAQLLPALQQDLPVPESYKSESPGSDSDLNAYDVIYYAGDCNAGAKTIAINLPNDSEVQLQKGTRRLQLKNAMRAKFDRILVPMAGLLIAEDQRRHISFEAFFNNVMFHEIAHGLGIKHTLTGKGTVSEALQDQSSALEEGKADILSQYMIMSLAERGQWDGGEIHDHTVTFLTSIFRSVRFGTSSSHGQANLVRFNYFKKREVFSRDEATGTYRVHFDRVREAVDTLSERILRLQGNGDYEEVKTFASEWGQSDPVLTADLERLNAAGIPVDMIFEQGMAVLEDEAGFSSKELTS